MNLYDSAEPIMRRLAVLKTNFPRVMILWARSPRHSVEIIKRLKEGHANLDLAKAERLGKNAGIGDVSAVPRPDSIASTNYSPVEVLAKLEGMTPEALTAIMRRVKNIYELVTLPAGKLQEIAGTIPGEAIYRFLHTEVKENLPAHESEAE